MKSVGMDLGQKYSEVCELDVSGEVVNQLRLPTTRKAITRWFGKAEKMEICIEAGGSSPWVDRLLRELGHDVVVVNPRRVKLIAESTLKTDKIDAEILARLLRGDRELLRPVTHRGEKTQMMRARLRVREVLIKARTASINAARGILRGFGYRLPSLTSEKFPEMLSAADLPEELKSALKPLVKTIEEHNEKLKELDEWVEGAAESYPEVERLRQIDGIGPLAALAFILCVEDPNRFSDSRKVAAFLGLRPRLRQSSDNARMGRISKEGDSHLRRLLVQCAHSLLRSRRPSELQSWGLALVERKGKKKAVVALARKLAVLMHRLWLSGADYDPLFEHHRRQRLVEQAQRRAQKKNAKDGRQGDEEPHAGRRTEARVEEGDLRRARHL